MSNVPIETFRQVLGYHPWHFWGFAHPTLAPLMGACDMAFEYPWQAYDQLSRAEIRDVLDSTERIIAPHLNYDVGPVYHEEDINWPTYLVPADRSRRIAGPDLRYLDLQLKWPKIHAAGVESFDLIDTPAVTLLDPNGDGLPDYFQVQVNTTVADVRNLAVYIAAADRLGLDGRDDRYRIAPIKASFSGGVATIQGPAWLLGKPAYYEYQMPTPGSSPTGLDPTDTNSFVSTLEVYRHYVDVNGTTQDTCQALLSWEHVPAEWWWGLCCAPAATDSSADPAGRATALARVALRDVDLGRVAPAAAVYNSAMGTWSAVDWTRYRSPDRVTVRYVAGLELDDDGQVQRPWREAVVKMAAAGLNRRIVACDTANKALYHWQFDLARTDGAAGETFTAIAAADLANPLGTRRGQIETWRLVQEAQFLGGIHI